MADDGRNMADPLCRLLMRSAGMEGVPGIKTCAATGVECACDEDEQKVLANQATEETRRWLQVAMALHMKHSFTHAAATDGSKKGKKVAYGVWTGVRQRRPDEQEIDPNKPAQAAQEREDMIGAGLWGGRLPDEWEVADAEMYAVHPFWLGLIRMIE